MKIKADKEGKETLGNVLAFMAQHSQTTAENLRKQLDQTTTDIDFLKKVSESIEDLIEEKEPELKSDESKVPDILKKC